MEISGVAMSESSLNDVNTQLRLVERYLADQIRYIY